MSFLYFAYGSNMLPARLLARCPSARTLGLALANGYDLAFSKQSKDGSGKASLVLAEGQVTPGILFEIDDAEQSALDRAEGAGKGYDRIDDFEVHRDGADCPSVATTYIASSHNAALKPFDWYLALVIAGAKHHGLDDLYIQQLRKLAHALDPSLDSRGRRDALRAFTASGIADYRTLWTDVDPPEEIPHR